MKSKGFTLIELVIVMVILAILVTLGVPKLLGQSDKAQKTKLISDGRVLEDAINRYYIDEGDWPRLTPEDLPLTGAELTSKIYALNDKGFEAPFAPEEGSKYYDINLEALKPYIKSFNSDIKHFVLQNPVGSVYIQDPKENTRLTASAQPGENQEPVHNFTFGVGTAGGTVSIASATIKSGESIQVTALPDSGYRFVSWVDFQGNIVSTNSMLTIDSVSSGGNYNANFAMVYVWNKYNTNSVRAVQSVSASKIVGFGCRKVTGGDMFLTLINQQNGSALKNIGDTINTGASNKFELNASFVYNSNIIGYMYDGGAKIYQITGTVKTYDYSGSAVYMPCVEYAMGNITSQGSTLIEQVTGENGDEYPDDGEKDGFWYVKQ